MITEGLREIDPSRFGFSKRLSLFEDSEGTVTFVVTRKSRFIMKDTVLFLQRAETIKEVTGKLPQLRISSPLCSKSLQKLNEFGISVSHFECSL